MDISDLNWRFLPPSNSPWPQAACRRSQARWARSGGVLRQPRGWKIVKIFTPIKLFCEPALPELLAAGNILLYLEHPASVNQCNAAKCKSNSQSKQTNTQNCKFHLSTIRSKLCSVIYCAVFRFSWSIWNQAGMQFWGSSNRMKTRAKV